MTDIKLEDTSHLPGDVPLNALNQHFHEQLSALGTEMRKQLDEGSIPVVIRLDSRLVLALGDTRTVLEVNEAHYHQLKALAHIPLFLFLAAYNNEGAKKAGATVREAIGDLRNNIATCSSILTGIERALTELLESPRWPSLEFAAVRRFNRELQTAFHTIFALAAKDETEQTVKVLHQMKSTVNDARLWQKAFYVVCAGHQPRYKQLGKSIFERWVFEETESTAEVEQRVLYGEALESVDAARDLVITRLVNGLIGDAFLNSPLSMNQDVLGQAGQIAIDEVFRSEAVTSMP